MKQTETCFDHAGTLPDAFEKLLVEISTHFINLPTDQIDQGIEEAQRRICACLGLDLSSLWQWEDRLHNCLTLSHLHSPPWGPDRPERLDAREAFPWQFQKVNEGETLAFSTEEIPSEAAIDQESRRHFGIKSSVVIPLSTGGSSFIGVLTFDTLREERTWSSQTVNRLKLVAQVFTNAIDRKESDLIRREYEARLALAVDSAGAGFWELNVNTGQFWTTEKILEIFGYPPGEIIDMKQVEQSIYPEDRDHVLQAIDRSLNEHEPINVEYRITVDDDTIKWINSSGRPYFKSNGEPDRILGVSFDITERKTFENDRLRSKERLISAIDIAGLGFYEMGEDSHIGFLDDRMFAFMGISPADETEPRQFWMEHIHQDDIQFVQGVIRKVLEEGVDRFELDYRYMHPERGLIWIHHLSRVLTRNDKGHAIRVIGVMQDITKQKQAENILRENRETLRNNQKDLQRLTGKLIAIREEELRGLSRELHDDLTQRLASIAIETGKLELQSHAMEQVLPEDFIQIISSIKNQLIATSEDVHRIARQLHPTILDDLGLVRAMESEIAAITNRDNLEINFSQKDIPKNIPKDISLCIYRIMQEGLKNIIRHANINTCEVYLQTVNTTLNLIIKDCGVGFDNVEVRRRHGLGLSSMRERVQLVRGDFAIESFPGLGTTLQVRIPLNMEIS